MRDNYTFDATRFEKNFSQLKVAGCKFVVASGNQYYQLCDIFPAHCDEMAFVAENGAFVTDGGGVKSAYCQRGTGSKEVAYRDERAWFNRFDCARLS